jgi:hypothetical protein
MAREADQPSSIVFLFVHKLLTRQNHPDIVLLSMHADPTSGGAWNAPVMEEIVQGRQFLILPGSRPA